MEYIMTLISSIFVWVYASTSPTTRLILTIMAINTILAIISKTVLDSIQVKYWSKGKDCSLTFLITVLISPKIGITWVLSFLISLPLAALYALFGIRVDFKNAKRTIEVIMFVEDVLLVFLSIPLAIYGGIRWIKLDRSIR